MHRWIHNYTSSQLFFRVTSRWVGTTRPDGWRWIGPVKKRIRILYSFNSRDTGPSKDGVELFLFLCGFPIHRRVGLIASSSTNWNRYRFFFLPLSVRWTVWLVMNSRYWVLSDDRPSWKMRIIAIHLEPKSPFSHLYININIFTYYRLVDNVCRSHNCAKKSRSLHTPGDLEQRSSISIKSRATHFQSD